MDLCGIGFSNIRLPNSSSSYVYTYDSRLNTFPEEVFIHEFLHTLERNLQERDYEIPALHDYEKYGYKEENRIGLKNWYRDYMNCTIKDEKGNLIGLDPVVYKNTPLNKSDFKYCTELEFSKEPQNIVEEIKNLLNNIFKMINLK